MRHRVIWIAGLFLLVLLWGLVVNIPAAQLLRVVQLSPQVGIAGLQGTITHGELEQVSVQDFSFTSVTYQLQPSCFFKLSLCYQLSADNDILINLERSLFSQNIYIQDSRLPIDESLLERIPNLLVKPTGRILADIHAVSLNGQKINDLNIDLTWLDAGISGEDQVLGDLSVQITQVDEGFKVQFNESESLIKVTGDINLNWNGQYRTNLIMNTQPALKESIKNALGLFAKKTNLNRYSVKQNGQIKGKPLTIIKGLEPDK